LEFPGWFELYGKSVIGSDRTKKADETARKVFVQNKQLSKIED
jgi:hypothetical protein